MDWHLVQKMLMLGQKLTGKSLGNGLGKSIRKKVGRWKIRCNRRLTFSLCGKIGKWDTVSGVGTNVGEKVDRKNLENIGTFFRKILLQEWVGNVGSGLVRPVRTCWDRFGPIFIGKMHIKNFLRFWVVHVFKMAL